MTIEQIDKMIHEIQTKSVGLYLRRQQIEQDKIVSNSYAQQVDHELLMLDGEIRILNQIRSDIISGSVNSVRLVSRQETERDN